MNAEDRLRAMERHAAYPPVPGRHSSFPDVSVTARSTWVQSIPPDTTYGDKSTLTVTEADVKASAVRVIEAIGNPLRELAAHLVEFADKLDRDGIVPVGIYTATDYWGSSVVAPGIPSAHVLVSVSGVRREWVEQNKAGGDDDGAV